MNYRNTLLLSAFLVGIIGTRSVLGQRCKIGEPVPGDTEPDLNITLSSNTAQVGGQIEITCDAGLPRFPLNDPNARPEPAAEIQISHDGTLPTLLKRCRTAGISQCKFTLQINETTPKIVVCRASNSGAECRIKFQSFNITAKAINNAMSRTSVPAVIAPSTTVQVNTMSTTSVPEVIAPSTTVQDNAMSTTSVAAVIAPSTTVQDNAMSTTSVPAVIAPSTTVQANSFTSMETPLMVASSSTPLATDSSSSLFLTASIVSRTVRFARSSSLPMESSLIPIPPIASSRALLHSDSSPSLQSSSPADGMLSSSTILRPPPDEMLSSTTTVQPTPGEGAPRPISGDDEELENVKTLVIATLILVVITIILLLAALLYLVMKFKN